MAKYKEIKREGPNVLVEYEKEQKQKLMGIKYKYVLSIGSQEILVEDIQFVDKFVKCRNLVDGKSYMYNLETSERVVGFDKEMTDIRTYPDAATFKYEGKTYITAGGKISKGFDEIYLIGTGNAFQDGKVQVIDGKQWYFINKLCQPVDNQRFSRENEFIHAAAYDLAGDGIARSGSVVIDSQLDMSVQGNYEFDVVEGRKVAGVTHESGLRRVQKYPKGIRKEFLVDLAGNRVEEGLATPEFKARARQLFDISTGKLKVEQISPELLKDAKCYKAIKKITLRNIIAKHYKTDEKQNEAGRQESIYAIMSHIEDVVAVGGMSALEFNSIGDMFSPEQEAEIKTKYKKSMQELENARELAFNPEIER